VGLTLAGDAHADSAARVVGPNGGRLDIVWADGWTAHLDQDGTTIVIADASGNARAQAGGVPTRSAGASADDKAHVGRSADR
jgi:hypothetical protein